MPTTALAGSGEHLDLPLWAGIPFVLILLAIAVVPLIWGSFWHRNRNKALVAAILGLPVAIGLMCAGPDIGAPSENPTVQRLWEQSPAPLKSVLSHAGTHALIDKVGEYASFIILLGALYTVSGGIVLRGDLQARPATNTAFLAFGAILANLIGTTGASILLIRPFLQTNSERRQTRHLAVFFIFVVSNLGGLLLPLGDPPLFLGFLQGVRFFWTLSLWPQWLVANTIVLTIFYVWDKLAYRRESSEALRLDATQIEPLSLHGLINFVFLAGIIGAVAFQSPGVGAACGHWLFQFFPCRDLTLQRPWGELAMLAMAALSLLATPKKLREANDFSWGAITEVAVLFAAIFVTMIPALEWLARHGSELGISEPWQYFWLSGSLSSFLDNAPTYLTFATWAAGPHDFGWLSEHKALLLAAVSTGSVFMGANSYIGNGPNFMVKAIADAYGAKTPSFFGYMAYSGLILIPVFVLLTFIFF
jgi:Na+/H+ antiporter NhaD/arsenite permease-like protein